jgi:hypothetical protein
MGQQSAGENQNQSGNPQGPSATHEASLFPRAVEPAFRFALSVVDTLTERRMRASAAGRNRIEVLTEDQKPSLT